MCRDPLSADYSSSPGPYLFAGHGLTLKASVNPSWILSVFHCTDSGQLPTE